MIDKRNFNLENRNEIRMSGNESIYIYIYSKEKKNKFFSFSAKY